MTPKEKAQQIFDLYFEEMLSFGFYLHNSQIKRLALIAVDEILNEFPQGFKGNFEEMRKQYWKEVKQETEKL
jgi:hypothetical protein